MGSRIDETRNMKYNSVTQGDNHNEGNPSALTTQDARQLDGKNDADQELEQVSSLVFEHDEPVLFEVGQIHRSSRLVHFGTLLEEKPPNVRKEESTTSVVRISNGVRVFVVNAMVPYPVVDRALYGRCTHTEKEKTDGKRRFV